MSFKALELQIAVPRTVEQSRNQQIQQNQQVLQNEVTAEELTLQTEQAGQTVTESDENAHTELRDRQGHHARGMQASKNCSDKQEETTEAPHPFKGLHFDIKM